VGLVTLLVACTGDETNGRETNEDVAPETADCGNQRQWDTGGDKISDRVEAENGGLFRSGRCDANPSEPRGKYSDGSLLGGVKAPASGAGYVRKPAGQESLYEGHWATLDLLACVELVARDLSEGLDPEDSVELYLGDLSLASGGEFEPHLTHQNGLEVEVRYPRLDGRDELFDIRREPELYDPLVTKNIFSAFMRLCRVDAIFADVTMLSFPVGEGEFANVINHPDRRTHFLVRLENPAGRG
jgi:hypothetical protein